MVIWSGSRLVWWSGGQLVGWSVGRVVKWSCCQRHCNSAVEGVFHALRDAPRLLVFGLPCPPVAFDLRMVDQARRRHRNQVEAD